MTPHIWVSPHGSRFLALTSFLFTVWRRGPAALAARAQHRRHLLEALQRPRAGQLEQLRSGGGRRRGRGGRVRAGGREQGIWGGRGGDRTGQVERCRRGAQAAGGPCLGIVFWCRAGAAVLQIHWNHCRKNTTVWVYISILNIVSCNFFSSLLTNPVI